MRCGRVGRHIRKSSQDVVELDVCKLERLEGQGDGEMAAGED